MVGDHHDIAGREIHIHRTGGVGHKQRLGAQKTQHTDGIADIVKIPALIGVEAALHHGNVPPAQLAKDELALVSRGGGILHVGNLRIGHHDGVFHLVAQKAQAGAQDQQDLGPEALEPALESQGALVILFKLIKLHYSFPPHSRQNSSPSCTWAQQVEQVGTTGSLAMPPLRISSSSLSLSISVSFSIITSDSVGVPVWVA